MSLQTDYIKEIDDWRDKLADNLNERGVEASQSEKLNALVDKVLDIPTGGEFCLEIQGDVFDADTLVLIPIEVSGTITES